MRERSGSDQVLRNKKGALSETLKTPLAALPQNCQTTRSSYVRLARV